MNKNRLEAFSDGVLAIIITIMVLELQIPEGDRFSDLKPLVFKFLSYIFSFLYVGIYWNNHHQLFQAVKHVNGKVLWANLHLLLWLSILPFATSWMGENNFTKNPVAFYGFVLLMCALAFNILQKFCLGYRRERFCYCKSAGIYFKGKTFGRNLYFRDCSLFLLSNNSGGVLLYCGTIMDYSRFKD